MGISVLVVLGGAAARANEVRPKGNNSYQIVTGDDVEGDHEHWESVYNRKGYVFGTEPAAFLKELIGRIPKGKALDIAMGEGRNAVFLAQQGFSVEGVDISQAALSKARRLARQAGVRVRTVHADLQTYQIKAESYDLIVNINYLQKTLVQQIKRGLKRGGVLLFESYTLDQLKNPGGQEFRRDYLLARGELKELFKDFELVVYRETNNGKEAVASLLARKP